MCNHASSSSSFPSALRLFFFSNAAAFFPKRQGCIVQLLWKNINPITLWATFKTQNQYYKWYQTLSLYTHSLSFNFIEIFFHFCECWKTASQLTILYFFLHFSLEMNSTHPFHSFDTQHSICEFIYFILFLWGSQN